MMNDLLAELIWEPLVRRPLALVPPALVVGGMGGSALAGDMLAFLSPDREVHMHRGYGVSAFAPADALYIAVSYSGTTEEVLSFANEVLRRGCRLAVVTSGGTLAEFAEREQVPLTLVPTGLAPRNALMYLTKALLALVQDEQRGSGFAHMKIDTAQVEEAAEQDAHFMLQSVPLFYTSERNKVLGTIGKIVMNETARMPAFTNVFPELNHNEMQSFDEDMPEGLEHLFRFFLVRDATDDERIGRRMDTFKDLMEKKGRMVRIIDISALKRDEALVQLWMRFLLAGRQLAQTRDIDPDSQPLIEEFKKLL